MRRPPLEGRDARDRESLRSEREMADEPDEVDEIARPRVLNIARERQGVELLRDVLIDRVDRESRPTEAEPLEDRIGEVGLELADDHVSRTDIDLEADELGPGEARDDDEPEAAARRAIQWCRRRGDLVTKGLRANKLDKLGRWR